MSKLDTDKLFCESGMKDLRPINWIYNSTIELYCRVRPFQRAV